MTLTRLLLAALLTAPVARPATLITFEGVPPNTPVGEFYNGGAGMNSGVSFNFRFHAVVLSETSGTVATITPASGSSAIINIPAGFQTAISLLYSGPGNTLALFDQPNAKGTQLSLSTLAPTAPGGALAPATVRFSGTARSVLFGFVGFNARKTFIDNLEFGNSR